MMDYRDTDVLHIQIAFLINHSAHYHAAHAVAFLEFMIEYYFFPSWKTFGMLNYLGK